MWRRVPLVRTDVSEERIACIIKVKRIRQLGTSNWKKSFLRGVLFVDETEWLICISFTLSCKVKWNSRTWSWVIVNHKDLEGDGGSFKCKSNVMKFVIRKMRITKYLVLGNQKTGQVLIWDLPISRRPFTDLSLFWRKFSGGTEGLRRRDGCLIMLG
jgi:hypothetical protein